MTLDVESLLTTFIDSNATDLYLTVGAPATFRYGHDIRPSDMPKIVEEDMERALMLLLNGDMIEEFKSTLEYNTAVDWHGKARFRVNVFKQRQHTGIVIRRIQTTIPSIESLNLPSVYTDLIMEKRGLVLIVGQTGSGKSTSLAAMLEHRNTNGSGHIVTIEDPIEYFLEHKNCIITQRDVGIDTYAFGIALKNALRQTPDVIVIGEIRDKETMEHAIVFSETGHLCLATLHANNSNQAIDRVINFFPPEKHAQILLNLSLNLKGILSQRLVQNIQNTRTPVFEIMLNQGLIKALVREGRVKELKECIESNHDVGMQSFDQALLEIFAQGIITEETALAESDSPANLRLAIKQLEMRRRPGSMRIATDYGLVNKQQF